MAHRLLRAEDAFWRESNQMRVLNTDLARQVFNDTGAEALWLVVGAPLESADTLQMSEAQLRQLYPEGPRAMPPELGGGQFAPPD